METDNQAGLIHADSMKTEGKVDLDRPQSARSIKMKFEP